MFSVMYSSSRAATAHCIVWFGYKEVFSGVEKVQWGVSAMASSRVLLLVFGYKDTRQKSSVGRTMTM